jgi:hypothetical protein
VIPPPAQWPAAVGTILLAQLGCPSSAAPRLVSCGGMGLRLAHNGVQLKVWMLDD